MAVHHAKVETHWDLAAYGVASNTGGDITFSRCYTRIDTDWFDGNAKWYFEIVGHNAHADTDYNVTLRDVTNGVDRVSISVPYGNPPETLYRSAEFSPAAGSGEVIYTIKVAQTPSVAYTIKSYTCRVVVIQDETATKTAIQIPMCLSNYGSYSYIDSSSLYIETLTGDTYAQGDPRYYPRWHKTAANWATVSGIALESVLLHESGYTASAALVDINDGDAVVVSNTVSGSAGNWLHAWATGNWGDAADGHDFELKIKSNNASKYCRIMAGRLIIFMSDLEKGEVYRCITRMRPAATTSEYMEYQRQTWDASTYSSPVCSLEASGYCADDADRVLLYEDDDHVGDQDGSAITGAAINFNSGTKAVVRAGPFTPTSGYDLFVYLPTSTAQKGIHGTSLVVAFEGEATLPTVTNIAPNIGSTVGGTEVVITGTLFTGATAVTFGGTAAASFTVDSDTQITAVTPAHAAGTVQTQVTTPGGSSENTAADDFEFTEPDEYPEPSPDTPYPPVPTIPADTPARVAQLIESPGVMRVGYGAELLDANDMLVEDISQYLMGGTVIWVSDNRVHRTCDIVLVMPGELEWATARVRLYQTLTSEGLSAEQELTQRFYRGVFCLTRPEFVAGEQSDGDAITRYQVKGEDKLSLLDSAEVGDTYVVATGTDVLTAIAQAITDSGYTGSTPLLDGTASGKTTAAPFGVWLLDPDEPVTYLKVVNDLCDYIGYGHIYADAAGNLRAKPLVSITTVEATWTLRVTSLPADIAAQLVDKYRKLTQAARDRTNWWRAVIRGLDAAPTESTPFDPETDTQYTLDQSAGGHKYRRSYRFDVGDGAALQAKLDAKVEEMTSMRKRIEIELPVFPVLDHDDIIDYLDEGMSL